MIVSALMVTKEHFGRWPQWYLSLSNLMPSNHTVKFTWFIAVIFLPNKGRKIRELAEGSPDHKARTCGF